MFLCGGTCNGDNAQPEIPINSVSLPAKFMHAITAKSKRSKKDASVMLKKSKYEQYLKECRQKNVRFVDKEFPPNEASLNFKVEGREITWKPVTEVVKNCVMVEDDFSPNDIQQGNIGDCYFLSSIAALADDEERIQTIFHNNFEISGHGIYKLIVVMGGIPTELVIDDMIPVFAATNRPVFCKSSGRQIWVILLEKAWAKIKGSYGDISSGSPHEVLQTFSVAPCFYYTIDEQQDEDYLNQAWEELTDAADEMMPMVAGTKSNVTVPGLLPAHAYTILDCENVPSYGKVCRLMKFRNPWGKTQYTGFASQNDKKFWDGVPESFKEQMMPKAGLNDGVFTMPFEEFMKSFNSVDILNCIFGFSYEFQKLKMYKHEPLFIRFDVKQEHETFITVQRQFKQEKSKSTQFDETNYGYSRLVLAHQLDENTFQYYQSQLETDFPDITMYTTLKPGRYKLYIEIDDNRLQDEFEATFSYYFDTLEVKENKSWEVEYGKHYPKFLEAVFTNHAIRLNNEKVKIGPRQNDWIATNFMYQEGGFGYVMCNLDPSTSIRMSVVIDRKKISENKFNLLGSYPEEQVISAGQSQIFMFSAVIDSTKNDNIVFPPPGFKVSKIA